MRNPALLLPFLLACGGQARLAPPPADPLPAMSRVFLDPFSGRVFVLVDDPVPDADSQAWATIAPPDAPMMYLLPADIADAADPAKPRAFTLVTADGATVVKSSRRVYLRGMTWRGAATTGFEIDADQLGEARFAITGEHADARLVPVEWTASGSPFAASWLHDQGWEVHDSWDGQPAPVFAGDIPGTELRFANAWLVGHEHEETLLVRGTEPVRWFPGTIDGVLSIDGRTPLIHETGEGVIELVEL